MKLEVKDANVGYERGKPVDGNATKIFMPAELSGIASATGMIGELFQGSRVTPQVKAKEPGEVPPPPEVR